MSLGTKPQHSVGRILLFCDDPREQLVMRQVLEQAGYDVITCGSGPSLKEILLKTEPRLVVLHLCLPGESGEDICRLIRDTAKNVPILVLSAMNDVASVVLLLGLGADSYMTTPFSSLELLARVKASMRHLTV